MLSSKQQGKANDLNQQAVELALKEYMDRQPARDAFMQGALTPIAEHPDISSAFSASQTNPFYSAPDRSAHVGSQLDLSGVAPQTPPAPPPGARAHVGDPASGGKTAIGSIFDTDREAQDGPGRDIVRSIFDGRVFDKPPIPPARTAVAPVAASAAPAAPPLPPGAMTKRSRR